MTVKTYQVRFYDHHPDNYAAVLMVHKEGRRGTVYSLCGQKFYELFPAHARELFDKCDIDSVDCTMTPLHARHFMKVTRHLFNLKLGEQFTDGGRKFVWLWMELIK